MAKRKRQTTVEDQDSEVPVGRGSLVPEAPEEFAEDDTLSLDEGAYKPLQDPAEPSLSGQSSDEFEPALPSVHIQRFSALQKLLVVSIIFVAAVLAYAVLKPSSRRIADLVAGPARRKEPAGRQVHRAQPAPRQEVPTDDVTQKEPSEPNRPAAEASPQPLSLTVAEASYLQKDYEQAYVAYDQLHQALVAADHDDTLKAFLQLKMGFCMKKAGNVEQANQSFKALLRSSVPAVRALAAYQQCLAEMQNKRYLEARKRAYQTIALLETIDFYRDWALSLERDCHCLAAESLTRSVLSLCDADKDLPAQLWSHRLEADPFINVSEAELRSFLNSGSDQLKRALLGPRIEKMESQDAGPRWSVICHSASIEELLARFAAHAGLNIQWAHNHLTSSEVRQGTLRKRPVSLYISATTPQQLVSVAAGCVGLLARLDDKGTVIISNPADYSSLSEHIDMLCREAISLWQRFLLTSVGDDRIADAHFALALLKAQRGNMADAIAEYKLVANRFSQTPFASHALLHSSRLKVELRDFAGARDDLKQLIELHPDTEFSDRACLYLADATMKAGLFGEAARLYRKAYNLSISSPSQMASALGAGRCSYEEQDYESATKWLNRYISLAKDYTSAEFNLVCFFLGKTYLALGKPEQACDALEYALSGRLPRQEYIGAISALVEAYTQQGHFVEALVVLEKARPWQFSQKESVDVLLLQAGVLRAMGLFDKAILVLRDRAEYLLDPQLKAKALYELAKCHVAEEDLELARRNLTEVLVLIEPGPFAQEVGCELADVCLQLGQDSQAISICSQVLDSAPSAPIRQKALSLLTKAHIRQKNYDRAALSLLGRPKVTKKPNINTRSQTSQTDDQVVSDDTAQ
jgi:tetratricopeptide (TPR) repeat protein